MVTMVIRKCLKYFKVKVINVDIQIFRYSYKLDHRVSWSSNP